MLQASNTPILSPFFINFFTLWKLCIKCRSLSVLLFDLVKMKEDDEKRNINKPVIIINNNCLMLNWGRPEEERSNYRVGDS